MLSINTPSLIDLLALLLAAHVTFDFFYFYWRGERRESDLYFGLMLVIVTIHAGLILYCDNVVPANVQASTMPEGAATTLWACRIVWANAMLLMPTAVVFALRYLGRTELRGWRVVALYGCGLALSIFCLTDLCFVPRPVPHSEWISWMCLVPWMPLPGPFAWVPVATWLFTTIYVCQLIWRRPHIRNESNAHRMHGWLVSIGVSVWGLAGTVDLVLAIQNYVGVSPSALFMAVAMLILSVGLAEKHAQAERQRLHVTRRFQSYVDPALVKYVIDHPESAHIEGEVRELTVVFTDLEGFTKISERLREGAVELLNEYLKLMTPLIRDHNGYRNKFLGDGMMFFYGAPEWNPDHAIHAVATVLKMQEMMVKLNETMVLRRFVGGEELPELRMRTGVSTGKMIVGDAGPEEASDYTVLGDTVNLGSRLESANKALGTRILLSERTVELLPKDLFLIRPIARLKVIGLSKPVMTYEPLSLLTEASESQRQMATLTQRFVNAFIRADFETCQQELKDFETSFGETRLGTLYRKQCDRYRAEPVPADFGGELVLTEK